MNTQNTFICSYLGRAIRLVTVEERVRNKPHPNLAQFGLLQREVWLQCEKQSFGQIIRFSFPRPVYSKMLDQVTDYSMPSQVTH